MAGHQHVAKLQQFGFAWCRHLPLYYIQVLKYVDELSQISLSIL